MIAGALGSGNGTTSYSENIGAIGITKVRNYWCCKFSCTRSCVGDGFPATDREEFGYRSSYNFSHFLMFTIFVSRAQAIQKSNFG